MRLTISYSLSVYEFVINTNIPNLFETFFMFILSHLLLLKNVYTFDNKTEFMLISMNKILVYHCVILSAENTLRLDAKQWEFIEN